MSTQSLLNRIPENTNFVQPTKFTFIIPELPFARYFCQTVLLPGASTNEVMVPSPLSEMYRHGDKLFFEPLNLTFLVDEDLRAWEETFNWLCSLTFPLKYAQYAAKFSDKYYDGILTVNTNSNVPNLRVKFTHCHPISLGAIQFDQTVNADTTPIADLSFRYDTFSIERF